MGQLKRRFYILGLSLLVLIVALAGLLGVLDILAQPDTSTNDANGNPTPIVSPPPSSVKPSATPTATATPTPTPTPKDPGDNPGFKLSLPDSFKLDTSKATNPGLSLDTTEPVHLPIMEVTGAENTNLLKSITSSFFNGEEWLPEELSDFFNYNGEDLALPELDPDQIVIDNITVSMALDIINGNTPIPVSLYPVSVNSSEPLLYFPDDMTFIAEEDFPEEYIFETIHYIFSRQELANADLDLIQQYLQLPDNITPRTRELAASITGGIESPYLMAKALEDYLKTNYTYDLDFKSAPEGWEPNDWFLFEEQSGVCTNFNSAFVILCRAAGIPSRLAGGFAITPQDEGQTVYADQAHAWAEVKFKDIGWQTFDATGSRNRLIPTETNIISAGPVTQKGHEFTVTGAVWADRPEPVDGALVEILVNETKDVKGAVLVGRGMVVNGRFDIKAVIPADIKVGEYQVMAHCLGSARYGESWSDPSIKVISGATINITLPPRIKNGEILTLTGTLTGEFGETLGGQQVEISIDGGAKVNIITDSAGRFSWEKKMDTAGAHTLKASYARTEYFLATSREAEFRVLAPAVLEIKADGALKGKPATISGRLFENTTETPLAGRSISIFTDNVLQEIKPVTDNEGNFSFDYIFKDTGEYRVEARFAGDTDYAEANAAADINVTAGSTFSVMILVIIILAAAAAGAGGWFIYHRMKNRQVNPQAGSLQILPESQETAAEPWQSSESGLVVSIAFPQIIDIFPDVWGTGEEFSILLRLTDNTGKGTAAPLDFVVNDVLTANPATDESGKAELKYVFPAKGQYNMAVKYENTEDKKKASAGRPLRIVDYREEIVRLFNSLLDIFRDEGITIPEKATPREIQEIVNKAQAGIPEKALEIAIDCFEETDYSLHIITREHYEYMYMAQKEIVERGNKPASIT